MEQRLKARATEDETGTGRKIIGSSEVNVGIISCISTEPRWGTFETGNNWLQCERSESGGLASLIVFLKA
jgi:hypothetical protein